MGGADKSHPSPNQIPNASTHQTPHCSTPSRSPFAFSAMSCYQSSILRDTSCPGPARSSTLPISTTFLGRKADLTTPESGRSSPAERKFAVLFVISPQDLRLLRLQDVPNFPLLFGYRILRYGMCSMTAYHHVKGEKDPRHSIPFTFTGVTPCAFHNSCISYHFMYDISKQDR